MTDIPKLKAEFFKALGHPLRIRVLELLSEGPKSVSTLLELMDTGQPQLSRHLAHLRGAGLVLARREGPIVVYCVADERTTELLRVARQILIDVATETRDGLRRS
jgi:DNA-binding transcriptional ArsR family regulator